MKKLVVLIATLTVAFLSAVVVTAVPAGAVVKQATRAYVGSARFGSAVHISGLVNVSNPRGLVRSPGRVVRVQRFSSGSWHTILWRVSNSAGRIYVGFIQPQSVRYRISVSGTSAALSANSAATLVRAAASSASGTVIHNAYTTGYGWPDNSPPGTIVSGRGRAGGIGTFANPITIAVGYRGAVPDYPYGTRFYIPNVRRYFVVQDTCAECHATPRGSSTWVDMWSGGNGSNNARVLACESAITGNHTIIRNPDAHRPVVRGALFNGFTCTRQFGG